jgi:hypothetical protein
METLTVRDSQKSGSEAKEGRGEDGTTQKDILTIRNIKPHESKLVLERIGWFVSEVASLHQTGIISRQQGRDLIRDEILRCLRCVRDARR